MNYQSTRGHDVPQSFSEILLGGLAQHGQRVAVDVLVLHVLVGFQLQGRDLREDELGQAGGDE